MNEIYKEIKSRNKFIVYFWISTLQWNTPLLLLLLHNVPCVKRFLFNKSADVFILCRHIMTPDSDVIIRLHSIMTSESGVIICLHSIKTPEFRLHYTWFRRHYTSKFGIFGKFLHFTVESFFRVWTPAKLFDSLGAHCFCAESELVGMNQMPLHFWTRNRLG